ncbi:MAG: hypothetical protein ACK55I_22415 [bacterium]
MRGCVPQVSQDVFRVRAACCCRVSTLARPLGERGSTKRVAVD